MFSKHLKRHSGSATIELVVAFPIFITIIFLVLKVGTFFYVRNTLLFIAQTVERRVVVSEANFDVDALIDQLVTQTGIDSSKVESQWVANGAVITGSSALIQAPGTLLTLTLEHTASDWLSLTSTGKQAVRVVMLKEGACSV